MIAKFDSDFCCDVGKFVQILHIVAAAAGQLGDFTQQAGTHLLFRSPAARSDGLKDADSINLHVGFTDRVLDLTFSIAAVVVAAIGDDQNGFARIARLFHLVHRHVHAIQQRGFAFGLRKVEPVLNFVGIGGERNHQLRPVVEFNQEEFIFRIGGLEKLHGGLARFLQLGAHAAAGIEHQADGKRRVLARKIADLLLDLVLE